jgi:hypothetical protein
MLLLISSSAAVSELTAVARAVGFRYETCDLQRALPLLLSNSYDAAVVDFDAAEPCLQFLEEVRAVASRKIPVAAIVNAPDLPSATRAGASVSLPRPVAPDSLRKTLASVYGIAISQRRRYQRCPVELPVVLTVDGESIEAKSTDIGSGGMAVVAPVPLATGSAVNVRFLLPGTERTVVASAEVRWADGRGRAGLCFTAREAIAPENWTTPVHAATPEAVSLPALRETMRTSPAVTPETTTDAAVRSGQLVLSVFLTLFCTVVVGFWIWLAISN